MGDLREWSRGVFFYEGEEFGEAAEKRFCSASILLEGESARRRLDSRRDAGATFCRGAVEALVEIFLEAGELDIEGEDLGGEGMLGDELLGAMNALLPDAFTHRGIMGLGPLREQMPENFSPQSHRDTEKIKDIEKPQDEKTNKRFSLCLCDSVVNGLGP